MGGKSPISLRNFEALIKTWHCMIRKRTKECDIIDLQDGRWICSFATVKGRYVKSFYLDVFLKKIKAKREQEKSK
ncbi:MAG: hypothetical protein K2Y22_07900 [Candidatus Obscuribacterales bacterium]|nr:hypothetical protein [Candidatus Obscuribacterales bacterium]